MSGDHDGLIWPLRLASLGERVQIDLGRSNALVWRIQGEAALFVKAEPIHSLAELPGEVKRLFWLASTTIAAPRVLDSFDDGGFAWLLMTALPGADLSQQADRPVELVYALAAGLKSLHALDPADCPFDHRLNAQLARGAANLVAGRVDQSDFDDARQGWTTQQVLDWLLQHRPKNEDLVVTHGDASLPNIMASDQAFAGFIDVGRLGVADRWQDLALACRSLIHNCGRQHVAPFLAAYGAEWDELRYRYYCTLDELF